MRCSEHMFISFTTYCCQQFSVNRKTGLLSAAVPRFPVYLLKYRYIFTACNTKLLKLSDRREHAQFKRTDYLVVHINTPAYCSSKIIKVSYYCTYPFVQFFAEHTYLPGVNRKLLLPPAIGYSPEEGNKCSRSSNNNPFLYTILYQCAVHFKCRT